VSDPKALAIYRQRYVKASCGARSPRRKPMARALYGVLAEVGGPSSVGPGRELDRGTFYRPEVDVALRLISLALMLAAWSIGAQLAGPRMLPDPQSSHSWSSARRSPGALAFNLGTTLLRVAVSFTLAMALGSVIAS